MLANGRCGFWQNICTHGQIQHHPSHPRNRGRHGLGDVPNERQNNILEWRIGRGHLHGPTGGVCTKRPRASHMQVEKIALRMEAIWTSMVGVHSHILYEQRLYKETCRPFVVCSTNLRLHCNCNQICRRRSSFWRAMWT